MSNKAKYFGIVFFCVSTALAAFLGTYAVFHAPHKFEIGQSEQKEAAAPSIVAPPKEEEVQSVEAVAMEDRINENTKFVYEYYYPSGGKTRSFQQEAPFALINLTREQLIKKIDGWQVISFSSQKVALRKNMEGGKNSHYILGAFEGYVAVFYAGSSEAGGLMEVTDTPVSSLSENEQLRLNEGIPITGEDNLIKVLEDYGS